MSNTKTKQTLSLHVRLHQVKHFSATNKPNGIHQQSGNQQHIQHTPA
jgi:hypothetical protein